MSEGCEKEERHISLTGTFTGCSEHGGWSPSSGMIEMSGIDPELTVQFILGAVEQVMTQFVAQASTVQDVINDTYDFGGELPYTLRDKAQRHIVMLLSHQLLLRQVADRQYTIGSESALLSVPRFKADE